MKRSLIIIFLLVGICIPAFGQVLIKGIVVYTAETAREEAFYGVEKRISMTNYKKHIKDENYEANKSVPEREILFKDRSVQLFKRGILKAYAVTYKSDPNYTYYYSTLVNNLLFFDIGTDCKKFPCRTLRYNHEGKLLAIGFYVSEEERFLYDKSGKLISHWVGKDGYNRKGKKIGNLEIISE